MKRNKFSHVPAPNSTALSNLVICTVWSFQPRLDIPSSTSSSAVCSARQIVQTCSKFCAIQTVATIVINAPSTTEYSTDPHVPPRWNGRLKPFASLSLLWASGAIAASDSPSPSPSPGASATLSLHPRRHDPRNDSRSDRPRSRNVSSTWRPESAQQQIFFAVARCAQASSSRLKRCAMRPIQTSISACVTSAIDLSPLPSLRANSSQTPAKTWSICECQRQRLVMLHRPNVQRSSDIYVAFVPSLGHDQNSETLGSLDPYFAPLSRHMLPLFRTH